MKSVKRLTKRQKDIILIVFGSFLSTMVLVSSLFALNFILSADSEANAPYFKNWIFLMFLSMSLARIPMTLEDKTKLNIIRNSIVGVILLGFAIVSLFLGVSLLEYGLIGAIFSLILLANRVIRICEKKSKRSIVLNIIASILLFSLALLFLFGITNSVAEVKTYITVLLLVITSIAIVDILYFCFSRIKLKAMTKIIQKTYAIEILYGLFVLIIASSFIFYIFEEKITSYGDALWYSFAIVTTIGFGDIVATSGLTRIFSVILGIYGLVVVAMLTSIVVNFYNEVSKKDAENNADKKDIDEIVQEQAEEETDKNDK